MDLIDQLVRIGRYHSRGLNSFAFSYVEVMRTNIFKNMVCTGECNLLVIHAYALCGVQILLHHRYITY